MDSSKKDGGAQIIDGIAIAKDIRTEIAEDVKRMNEVYGKVSNFMAKFMASWQDCD
jgi:hypothetical protein